MLSWELIALVTIVGLVPTPHIGEVHRPHQAAQLGQKLTPVRIESNSDPAVTVRDSSTNYF